MAVIRQAYDVSRVHLLLPGEASPRARRHAGVLEFPERVLDVHFKAVEGNCSPVKCIGTLQLILEQPVATLCQC